MKKIFILVLLGTAAAISGTIKSSARSPNYLWALGAGASGSDWGTSVATDANGNSIVTGEFESSTLTFGTTTLTSAGNFDMFLVKLNSVAGVEEISGNDGVNVYPNPSTGVFDVQCSMFNLKNAEVYDVLGNPLLQKTLNSKQGTLNLSGVNNGVYFLTLKTEQGIITQKLIIQK
jgi:hypothetical protein